jgi:hypothetical protein
MARVAYANKVFRAGFPTRLSTFEYVPSDRVPSTAHHIFHIRRIHYPDCLSALDTTPGERCFWHEKVPTGLSVTFSDSDVRSLPYADLSYDLGLVDLPHLTDLGKNSILVKRYGTLKTKELEPLVRAGVAETWRVSARGLIVKVTDHVHGQRYQDESAWVQETLGRPYARVYAVHRPIGCRSEPQLSADSNGSVYLLYRRGSQLHSRRGWQLRRLADRWTDVQVFLRNGQRPTGGCV